MGLVPACTRIGDAVAIFVGFHTPFTIRIEGKDEKKADGLERVHAKLIGDTYYHGMMEGEALVEAAEAGLKPSEIILA